MQSSLVRMTHEDHSRVGRVVRVMGTRDAELRRSTNELRERLERATLYASEAIPPDVVTMGSTVRFRDLEDRKSFEYTVVYPGEADITRGRISVLAPLGAALLGSREGQEAQVDTPAGSRRIRVERVVSQPEREMLRIS